MLAHCRTRTCARAPGARVRTLTLTHAQTLKQAASLNADPFTAAHESELGEYTLLSAKRKALVATMKTEHEGYEKQVRDWQDVGLRAKSDIEEAGEELQRLIASADHGCGAEAGSLTRGDCRSLFNP